MTNPSGQNTPSRPAGVELLIDGDGFGQLVVDGSDISAAVGDVTIAAQIGAPSMVTAMALDGTVVRVEVGMPVVALIGEGHDVRLRDRDRKALIALGWTPPVDEATDDAPAGQEP